IDPDDIDRRGRVKVAGEDWGALTAPGAAIPEGSKVRIASMEGTRVMVERIANDITTDRPPTGPPVAPPTSPPAPPSDSPSGRQPGRPVDPSSGRPAARPDNAEETS
ncbi:MAG: NfeD family protein, partial [Actinomycetota bacterium]